MEAKVEIIIEFPNGEILGFADTKTLRVFNRSGAWVAINWEDQTNIVGLGKSPRAAVVDYMLQLASET